MSNEVAVKRLTKLEGVIEKGMTSFVDVGNALAEIRNQKLYLEAGFHNWEDYVSQRWGMQKRWSYQLIESARIAGLLPSVDIKVGAVAHNNMSIGEYQLRPLETPKLSDAEKVVAFNKALDVAEKAGTPITGRLVQTEVDKLLGIQEPAPEPKAAPVRKDQDWYDAHNLLQQLLGVLDRVRTYSDTSELGGKIKYAELIEVELAENLEAWRYAIKGLKALKGETK